MGKSQGGRRRHIVFEAALKDLEELQGIDFEMRAKLDTERTGKLQEVVGTTFPKLGRGDVLDTLQYYYPPKRPAEHKIFEHCPGKPVETAPPESPSKNFEDILESVQISEFEMPLDSDNDRNKRLEERLRYVNEFFKNNAVYSYFTNMQCHGTTATNIEGGEFLDSCFQNCCWLVSRMITSCLGHWR